METPPEARNEEHEAAGPGDRTGEARAGSTSHVRPPTRVNLTEAELRSRFFRVMVGSGAKDVRLAYRRARELTRFLMRPPP